MADIQENRYWDIDSIQEFCTFALGEVDKICRNNNIHYYIVYGTLLGAIRHKESIPWDADADICIPQQEMKKFVKAAREQLPDSLYIDYSDENPEYIYTFPRIARKGFSHDGCHLDVFPLVGLPKGKKERSFLHKYEWARMKYGAFHNNWGSRIHEIDRWRKNKLFVKIYRFLALRSTNDKLRERVEKLGSKYNVFEECNNIYDCFRIYPAEMFKTAREEDYDGKKLLAPALSEAYLKQTYGDYMSLPKNKSYQELIKSTRVVAEDLRYKRAVYIDSFDEITEDKIDKIKNLRLTCGSLVAIAELTGCDENKRRFSEKLAKSIRYFDKVIVNADGEEGRKKALELIDADYCVDVTK